MGDTGTLSTKTRLDVTLQQVASDVVHALDYICAMVATYEKKLDALILRVVYFDPDKVSVENVKKWEDRVSTVMGRPVSITEPTPDINRVYVYDKKYKENLGYQAYKAQEPVKSNEFYSLLTPIVPSVTRPIFSAIQKAFRIKQVVAVPFYLQGTTENGGGEIVGNLFAIKGSEVTDRDIRVLAAFGRQAASAIELERHRSQVLQVAEQLTNTVHSIGLAEKQIFHQIAKGVVEVLGYVGALVSSYDTETDSLPLRVAYLHPAVLPMEQLHRWEDRLMNMTGRPTRISEPDPDFARVFVDNPDHQNNLSVQAVKAMGPVVSDELFSLFTPILPNMAKSMVSNVIQPALGIKQVIAVPFYLEATPPKTEPELVGSLFVATAAPDGFQPEEIQLLEAFGEQAAAGLRNAELYRQVQLLYSRSEEQRREIQLLYQKAEEQRQVAEVFGKMAFSAAANVHALRNHIGAFRAHLQILIMYKDNPEQLDEILKTSDRYVLRLSKAAEILDSLHEPWREQSDQLVNVNRAVQQAISKANDLLNAEGLIVVDALLEEDLPPVKTSFDMFAEAFRILVKNGMEAILENIHKKGHSSLAEAGGVLRVQSRSTRKGLIEVLVTDTGVGIPEEHLDNIFQLRWSTKDSGMGFGLFWLKDYIEGLNGSVEVRTQVGQGTTFHISVPCYDPANSQDGKTA